MSGLTEFQINNSTELETSPLLSITVGIRSLSAAAQTKLCPYVRQKEACIFNQKGYSSHRLHPL